MKMVRQSNRIRNVNIVIDRIDRPPPHSLDRTDIKALLSMMPGDWNVRIKTVHLRASIEFHTWYERPAHYDLLQRRLSICSRGLDPIRHVRRFYESLPFKAWASGRM
jgi:hypothetical protein